MTRIRNSIGGNSRFAPDFHPQLGLGIAKSSYHLFKFAPIGVNSRFSSSNVDALSERACHRKFQGLFVTHGERRKKVQPEPRDARSAGDSLAAFFERLRDLCANHGLCHGQRRADRCLAQTEQTVALAAQLGILKQPEVTWAEFVDQISGDFKIGSEHVVDFSDEFKLVGKTTKPPYFGLVPEVRKLPVADLRHPEENRFREVIEFFPATPLEYLSRWLASNEVFADDVRLVSVIKWRDGLVSLGITQPQYHGIPAEPREIEEYFKREGWSLLNDPSGHTAFYNYAFGIMAIDAEKRNCYITEYGIQPFDVILCSPDSDLERFLKIYPE